MALLELLVSALMLLNTCRANCGSGRIVRLRLNNETSGFIVHPTTSSEYPTNSKCSWFIQNDDLSTVYIKLKFTKFNTECLWDYLHIFNGDSIYATKLAAFTGNISLGNVHETLPTTAPVNNTNHTISSGSGQDSGHTPLLPYTPTNEITLSSDGPHLLIYFFADEAVGGSGFNISYWVSTCISNCSGHGYCHEPTGVCSCDVNWTGEYCQNPLCPNNCYNKGACINKQCHCNTGYTGIDCSINVNMPHWNVASYNSGVDFSVLRRAGHSAVVWGNYMWVYGGYQFNVNEMEQSGSGSGLWVESNQLIRYHLRDQFWEPVLTLSTSEQPHSRYSHSAVVYEDAMYIYGGALLPTEVVTNELWKFNFTTLTWSQIRSTSHGNESRNETDQVMMSIGVKDHTAHVIGNKMIIIFGYSEVDTLLNYVQEFNLVTEIWSSPPQYGELPEGRLGHSSVFVPELNVIYIYGGEDNSRHELSTLLAYEPHQYYWKKVSTGPVKIAFHNTVLVGGALVSFGGYSTKDCFEDWLVTYNLVQDEWSVLSPPGLPGNASRYGYTAVTSSNTMLIYGGFNGQCHNDILLFNSGNCTYYNSEETCRNMSLCMWVDTQCTDLVITNRPCHLYTTCNLCNNIAGCQWRRVSGCVSNSTQLNISNDDVFVTCPEKELVCSHFDSCQSCHHHEGCVWNNSKCTTNTTANVTMATCDTSHLCSMKTSCSQCLLSPSCLWCPTLRDCVPSSLYPYLYPYGQCLGWEKQCKAKPCADHQTCLDCHNELGCGWCRDPADTGLGICGEGGFLASRNESFCSDSHWFFDECPSCNCNGHSSCDNNSNCISCVDNTEGGNCQRCKHGFYGNPVNGGNCSVCDCNGYNNVCDTNNGTCDCLDAGVSGDHCTICNTLSAYQGNASNFCYYEMRVGFIYTFGVTDSNEKQSFFTTTPSSGSKLNVKFEISRNLVSATIGIQFFLGRVSDNYMLLYNLTSPINISNTDSYKTTFKSFTTSSNGSIFYSFARPSIQNTLEYNWLLGNITSNGYTNSLWDGDVSLVIYVYNLQSTVQYKITLDQTDLIFLVYFFVTFLTCFTILLTIFLLGWYIKRKIEVRAFIRAQHIELQRRVRRPFTRIKAIIEKSALTKVKQHASYVAVETCRDERAAILTLLLRLPGDCITGHPKPNRTGICFASTFVKMNVSKKDKKKHSRSTTSNNTIDS